MHLTWGEGGPWIYKIMPHLYTSLAFGDPEQQKLPLSFIGKIHSSNYDTKEAIFGSRAEIAQQVSFSLKTAEKCMHHSNAINDTMGEELNFVMPMEITFMDNGGNIFVLCEFIDYVNLHII